MSDESPASFLYSPVPKGWDCVALDDLVDPERGISYGIVQPGTHDPSGVPTVRVNNLRGGRIETADVMRVSTAVEEKYSRTRLRGGEVLLSLVGTLGECAIVPSEVKGWNVARAVAVIPIKDGLDARWITTCLRSAPLQHLIGMWATTTVQATFNLRDVRRLPIVVPPETTREWMIRVLSSLDDKIELNRRMNGLLEGMARAIFKAWFIDFEPVKAKAAGAASFRGMPQHVFDGLPDSFANSELGEIPEGWEDLDVSDICTVGRGGSPRPINSFMNGTVPWIKIADATASTGPSIFETKERLKEAGVSKSVRVQPGDLILSNSATCGIPMFVELHGCIHDGWLHFKGLKRVSKLFLFHALEHLAEHLVRIADGSVQKNLNTKLVGQQRLVIPPTEITRVFDETAGRWFDMMRNGVVESRVLSAIRDTLLPKLISGEISVPSTNGGSDGG